MREVFRPAQKRDPGRVFYTITEQDVGTGIIQTEIGTIHAVEFIGRVQRCDVGKRLYRVPNNERNYWFWQMESEKQRDERLAKAP